MTTSQPPYTEYNKRVLYLLICVGAVRLISLYVSPLNLHGDEAQYWAWSRALDWGYFSKPPMIAWLIGATTFVFGNAEWAVRLSTPIIHPITAYIIFRTARYLFDARTGFWAACLYFLMPAVWLSSGIVSTDVALLCFWAAALNAWVHLRDTPNFQWAALLGAAIGFGMMSKYAMLFFIIALALSSLIDTKTRKALISKYGVVAGVLALLIISPNLYWNAAHDFATLGHTAANANLGGSIFHPFELIEFTASQLAVFGPVSFVLLILACLFAFKSPSPVRPLALFVLTPLLVISAEALLSRANANWAVSSYIAGSILAAHYGLKAHTKFMKPSLWVNVAIGILFMAIGLAPSFANALGGANGLKRMRAWPQTTQAIESIVARGVSGHAFASIATDNRLVFYDLLYYGVESKSGLPLRMWMQDVHVDHHAEATAPLTATQPQDAPILIINYYNNYEDDLREDFETLIELPKLSIDLGGGKQRVLRIWAGYGYTPTTDPER